MYFILVLTRFENGLKIRWKRMCDSATFFCGCLKHIYPQPQQEHTLIQKNKKWQR